MDTRELAGWMAEGCSRRQAAGAEEKHTESFSPAHVGARVCADRAHASTARAHLQKVAAAKE
tara:strand:+ start:441 stop:626 length:186 start_codon:yes stop_codon:yes gene_type:complete